MHTNSTIVFNEVIQDNQLNQLQAIAEQIWHEYYTAIIGTEQVIYMLQKFQTVEAMRKQIEHGYRYILVEHDDKPIGYMAAVAADQYLYISKLYLLQASRGKGMARLMLAYLEQLALDYNFKKLRLNVNKYNDQAIAVYERLGFVKIGEENNDIGEGFFMDDYVMEKSF